MFTIANLLTVSRIVAVPLYLGAAILGHPRGVLVLLAWAIFSDFIDGTVARALGQESEFGTTLDSIADCALYLSAPIAVLIAFPTVRERLGVVVAIIWAGYFIPVAYGWMKFARLTAYHTFGSRLAGILLGLSLAVVFFTPLVWPLYVATGVHVLAELEELAITWTLPEWRASVSSFRHAHTLTHRRSPYA
jgi:CDP-diacylglycerol--glycerol-3-phosphate 3-phosphatidyltransferase